MLLALRIQGTASFLRRD